MSNVCVDEEWNMKLAELQALAKQHEKYSTISTKQKENWYPNFQSS